MQYGESSLPKGQPRTPPLNSAAASRRMCPDDPPRHWIREVRFLRGRDHAVTWCAGRESCRSLDGSRTAQTDQSGSNQFTRIASTAAWPMNRKAKTCTAALRRGSDSDSAIPGRQEPG